MTVTVLAVIFGLTQLSRHAGLMDLGFVTLLQYQEDKLAAHREAEIVFVGDSSLGNGISAHLFSSLSGKPATNLALTGRFGTSGSANFAMRAHKSLGAKFIIVMQSVEIASRPRSTVGDVFTRAADARFDVSGILAQADFLISESAIRASAKGLWRALMNKPRRQIITDDYVQQTEALTLEEAVKNTSANLANATAVNADALLPLRGLSAYCKANGIKCFFAHGPLLEFRCKAWEPYIEAAAAAVSETGLSLVNNGQPYCFPPGELGDSADHVAPVFKEKSTRFYAEKILSAIAIP
jgi:hypothetical protein